MRRSWIDISTGSFETASLPLAQLEELLARLDPSEILADPALIPDPFTARVAPNIILPGLDPARSRMAQAFDVAQLAILGDFTEEEIRLVPSFSITSSGARQAPCRASPALSVVGTPKH